MRSSINKVNGNYIGDPELYYVSGIHSVNKDYNRLVGTEWIRPSEWLPLPNLSGITQAIVGLVAILPGFTSGHTGITSNSNFLAIRARPAYIVDWGDGTTGAFADLATASKQYNYYSLPDGNLTSEGYKQVIIQITPQSPNNLTYVDFNVKAVITGVTLPNGTPQNYLEIKIKGPNLNNSSAPGANSKYPLLKNLEFIGPTQLTNTSISGNFNNLENVGGSEWTRNRTSNSTLFVQCNSIKNIPLLETKNATSMLQMTNSCFALKYFPPIDTTKVTNFNSTFFNNYSLEFMPYIDTSLSTEFLQMHTSNHCLRKIPEYNTASGVTMNSMFTNCYSLLELPLLNTSNIQDFGGSLNSLFSIKTIPPLNTSQGKNFGSWLRSTTRVNVYPEFNYSNATNLDLAYANNLAGWKIATVAGGTGLTGYRNTFAASRPIIAGISASFSGATFYNTSDGGGFFAQSARIAPAYNAGATISYINTSMSPTALNELFTSLATLSGVCASINITGNWGSSGCNRSIATSKGWTVIG
jgi:hypothetical protein